MINGAIAQNPISARSTAEIVPTAGNAILVDLTVYVPGVGLQTLHYCSGNGYVVGGIYYEPRVKNPGSLKTMLFGDGTTFGRSAVGYGELVLANPDGALDEMLNYGIAGRSIVIRKLIAGVAVFMMSCAMEQPTPSLTEMTIRVKDMQTSLEAPLQLNKYLGNNALPNGLEGLSDIKGKEKPLIFGVVKNRTPELVNTSRLIYQANDGAVSAIPGVYDKGVPLTAGDPYASQVEMETVEPLPGTYRAWLAGGYFRLGATPAGQITCDVTEGATAADRTVAQLAKRMLLKKLADSDLYLPSFTALDALNSAEAGIGVTGSKTANEALDEILNSIGAWRGFDANNKIWVGRLDAPSGSSALDLTGSEILDLQMLPSGDKGNGLPVYEVDVSYAKNYTVQTSDLAGSIDTPKWQTTTVSANAKWESIAYGDGQFIMVGRGTGADYSEDGIIWKNDRPLPVTAEWASIAYGKGQFVAISQEGYCYRRGAGDTAWTAVTIPDLYTFNYAVCFAGGRFYIFAVSSSKTQALTSTDGINWATMTLPESQQWQTAVYGNGIWVALSNITGHAATSVDGTTWTAQNFPFAGYPQSLIFGNGIFLALNGTTTAYTSTDGLNWTPRTTPAQNGRPMLIFTAGMYVTVSSNGNDFSMYSPNGIDWNTLLLNKAANRYGLASNGATVVTVVNGNGNPVAEASYLRVGIDVGRLQFLANEYRTVKSTDAAVLTVHPRAELLALTTLLASSADAQVEADRQLSLRKVRRDYIAITCKRSALPAQVPMLGSIVKVTYSRFGYDAGRLFVFLGTETHLDRDDITLYLWG